MWWPIMESLGDWLKADTPRLDGVSIRYGLSNPRPDGDFVDLRYGGAGGFEVGDQDNGEDNFWVDVFVRLDRAQAETDATTGIAYERLHALQLKLLSSIGEWWRDTESISGAAFRTAVKQINPDGEHYRDTECAAVRIVLTIDWRNCGA